MSLIFHQILAKNLCPTEELTEECKCNLSTSIIICKGDFNEERWDQILDEIGDKFNGKILKGFHLSSKKLTILNKNAFKNLKFKKLFIFSPKLTFIHRDAFDGLENQLEEINIYRSNLTNVQPESEFNLFKAFTKLIQLQQLTISDSNLVKIPKEAFKPDDLTKIQNNFTSIYFINLESKNVKLKTIGSKAFYYLPSLKLIDFTGQKIDKIKKEAFKFKNKSEVQLMIDLSGNLLHGESFENESLTGIQRPTRIYFGLPTCNQNLTHLKYEIFYPFLNQHQQNKIDLGKLCENIICDCKINWIAKFRLESRVKNLKCKNNMMSGLKSDAKCQNQNQIQGKIEISLQIRVIRSRLSLTRTNAFLSSKITRIYILEC